MQEGQPPPTSADQQQASQPDHAPPIKSSTTIHAARSRTINTTPATVVATVKNRTDSGFGEQRKAAPRTMGVCPHVPLGRSWQHGDRTDDLKYPGEPEVCRLSAARYRASLAPAADRAAWPGWRRPGRDGTCHRRARIDRERSRAHHLDPSRSIRPCTSRPRHPRSGGKPSGRGLHTLPVSCERDDDGFVLTGTAARAGKPAPSQPPGGVRGRRRPLRLDQTLRHRRRRRRDGRPVHTRPRRTPDGCPRQCQNRDVLALRRSAEAAAFRGEGSADRSPGAQTRAQTPRKAHG